MVLRAIPANESAFIYDELVLQWLAQGRNVFSRSDFQAVCKQEGTFDFNTACSGGLWSQVV